MHSLKLVVLEDSLAVCRSRPDDSPPPMTFTGSLFAVIQTPEEVTIICPAENIPAGVEAVPGWRALKVRGPLDLSMTGVMASLALPLAERGVSIFAISTYDTDYLLVKVESLSMAVDALRRAGHTVDWIE